MPNFHLPIYEAECWVADRPDQCMGYTSALHSADCASPMLIYQLAFADTPTISHPLRIAHKFVGEQHTPFLLQQVKGIPCSVGADCISRRWFGEARERVRRVVDAPLF
jgi:hypothetical protein